MVPSRMWICWLKKIVFGGVLDDLQYPEGLQDAELRGSCEG